MSTFWTRRAYAPASRPAGARTCFGCHQPALLLHQLLKPEMRLRGGIESSRHQVRRWQDGYRSQCWLVIGQTPSCCHRFFAFFLFVSGFRLEYTKSIYQVKSGQCLPAWSWDAMQRPFSLNCVGCLDWQHPSRDPCQSSLSELAVLMLGVATSHCGSESLGKGRRDGHGNGAAAPKLQVDRLAVCRDKRVASLCSFPIVTMVKMESSLRNGTQRVLIVVSPTVLVS